MYNKKKLGQNENTENNNTLLLTYYTQVISNID